LADRRRHRDRRAVGAYIARQIQMTHCRSWSPPSTAWSPRRGLSRPPPSPRPRLTHRHPRRDPRREPRRDGDRLTIGAITFTRIGRRLGKLQGLVSGRPLVFPASIWINARSRHPVDALIVLFVMTEAASVSASCAVVAGFRLSADRADRGADMPVVISMLNSYSAGRPAASAHFVEQLLIITGALVGSSGASSATYVQGDEPLDHQRDPGGFGTEAAPRRPAGRRPVVKSAAPRMPPSS